MIDRFLYWGNHVEAKSGKIKGSCQPPLATATVRIKGPHACGHGMSFPFFRRTRMVFNYVLGLILSFDMNDESKKLTLADSFTLVVARIVARDNKSDHLLR